MKLRNFLLIAGLLASGLASEVPAQPTLQTQCVSSSIAGGTADALTVPLLPCVFTTNLLVLTPIATNLTGNPTLQMTGFGPQPILSKVGGAGILAGTLTANTPVILVPTGTSWIMVTNPAAAGAVTSFNSRVGVVNLLGTDLGALSQIPPTAHQFLTSYSAGGVFTLGQPVIGDLQAITTGILGSPSGGVPVVLTANQSTALLNDCSSLLKGLVPTPNNNTATFLRGDCQFATPAGGGNFSGPASSTTNDLVSFNGTSGTLGKDSGILASNVALLNGIQTFSAANTFSSSVLFSGTIGVAGTTQGTVPIAGATSGTVTIATQAAAGTWTLLLPTTAGTANLFLQTDGTGKTTWATLGSSGTVNNCGTAGNLAFYATIGNTVSCDASAVMSGGTLTLGQVGSVLGVLQLNGSTSGTINMQPQAAAGTYNWNWPTSPGVSGQTLISGGGGATAMTFGVLQPVGGGTGNATLTANGLLVGNGTSPTTSLTPGANNTCPVSNGTIWTVVTCPGGGFNINLSPGLSNTVGANNSTPVTSALPNIFSQFWPTNFTANHTVLTTEAGGLDTQSGASPVAFTLPVVGTGAGQLNQGSGVCFEFDGTGGGTVTSASTIVGLAGANFGQFGNGCFTADVTNSEYHFSGSLGGALAGVISISGAFTNSSQLLDLAANGIALSKLAQPLGGTVLGNPGASAANVTATSIPVLGIPGTTAGTLGIANGGGSGATITIQNLGATSAFNFNLPTTAGTAGGPLLSQAGGSTSMTWGTISGNTAAFATVTGSKTLGSPTCYDANGNLTIVSCNLGTGSVTNIAMGAGIASSNVGGQTAITSTGTVFADASFFPFYLGGLTLSNDGVTPNTVLDVAAGAATSDDNTVFMKLASFTKSIASTWALGSGSGCLDTGTVANTTTYHIFVIERTDTSVVDVLCSTSATAPTFPTNYTKKRRIGSFLTDGSAHFRVFTQVGNIFYWGTQTVQTSTIGTTASLVAPDVPTGIKLSPLFRYSVSNAGAASCILTSGDESDVAPGTAAPFTTAPGWDWNQLTATTLGGNSIGPILTTNTSAQVRARCSAASTTVNFVTRGWVD